MAELLIVRFALSPILETAMVTFRRQTASIGCALAAIIVSVSTIRVRADFIEGTLSTTYQTNANLTTEGSTDWALWGAGSSTSLAPSVSMVGGTGISNLINITNGNPLRGVGQFGRLGGMSSFMDQWHINGELHRFGSRDSA
jgi:hypothetical protein